MGNLTDALLPGNRRILVNGVAAATGRDTLEIVCIGASLSDDAGRQLTRVALPSSGTGPTEWVQFVPTVTASGGGFAIGNGEFEAWWRQDSTDNMQIAFMLVVGSTTNMGTGDLHIDFRPDVPWDIDSTKLPLTAIVASSVELRDASTPTNNRGGSINYADEHTLMILPLGVSGQLTSTVPFTWANGDQIKFHVSFPIAPPP